MGLQCSAMRVQIKAWMSLKSCPQTNSADSDPKMPNSNYPPAEPGALRVEPLKAAIGVADAPPMFGPPEGGQRVHDASRFLAGAVGRVQFRLRDLWKGPVLF